MYSLYRAWLMRDAMTAASLASPPDLIITVGGQRTEFQEDTRTYGYQFVAHKYLVSMHSGYLKSLIQNESQEPGLPVTNISLPNITSESFAPLLSYMYTGYLDLTNENIYSVLLATHLLHMPRALDLCRAFLVQNQRDVHQNINFPTNSVFSNANIIKPIPSRKVNSVPHYVPPPNNLPPLLIQTRPDGPFQSISSSVEKKEVSPPSPKNTEAKSPLAVPSTSKADGRSSALSEASLSVSDGSCASDDRAVRLIKSPQRKTLKRKEFIFKNFKKINNENLKVEYDVACCDGPVRFHRVLNESYGMTVDEIIDNTETDENSDNISDKEYLENYPKTQFLRLKSSKNFSNYMHQQMINANSYKKSKGSSKGVIQMRKLIEKEIEPPEKVSMEDNQKEKEDANAERAFTCLYCKHTFKSQYCYQKHTKRHINSVEDSTKGGNKNFVVFRKLVSDTKLENEKENGNVRREVRLLDMNVQYYPCKTCGSKFPSYYFVHKHRKLCHSNEENFDDNSNIPIEDVDSQSAQQNNAQPQQ